MRPRAVIVKTSPQKTKKYQATFFDINGSPLKTINFGHKGSADFTQHRNTAKKEAYIARHQPREDWNDPMTAGALSRWLLWNKPTLDESLRDFKQMFKFV